MTEKSNTNDKHDDRECSNCAYATMHINGPICGNEDSPYFDTERNEACEFHADI